MEKFDMAVANKKGEAGASPFCKCTIVRSMRFFTALRQTQRRPGATHHDRRCRLKLITGRQRRAIYRFRETRSLSALARAGFSEEDDIHEVECTNETPAR